MGQSIQGRLTELNTPLVAEGDLRSERSGTSQFGKLEDCLGLGKQYTTTV